MSHFEILSILLVAIGAGVMLDPIATGMRIRARVPAHLRPRWLLLIWLMGFFLVGYLLYIASMLNRWPLPLDLVTGVIFAGGAFFVLRVISLSRVTIDETRLKNQKLEGEIQERIERERKQKRYEKGMETLDQELRELILAAGDKPVVLHALCAALKRVLVADLALLPLLEEDGAAFVYQEAIGHKSDMVRGERLPLEAGGLCGMVFTSGKTVCMADLKSCPHAQQDLVEALEVSTALVAPLWNEGKVIGGLSVFRGKTPFDDIDTQLLTLFAQRASILLQNMNLLMELEERVADRTAELHAQNKLLEQIISHIPSSVFWKDDASVYRGCNPRFANMIGLDDPADICGKSDYDLPWPRQIADKFRLESAQVIRDASDVLLEDVVDFDAAGEPRYSLSSRIALRDTDSHVTGVLGIIDDITDRKRAEQVIASEHSFLQNVIDGVVDPTYVIGLDYKIRLMNSAARQNVPRQLNQNDEALCCYQVSHQQETPCDGQDHPCPLRQVRDTGEAATVVHQHRMSDGALRSFELLASPLWDDSGQLTGIIESARDITDRLKVEKDLRENEKHLEFLAHHDSLTGLPNRLLLNDRLRHAMANASRTRQRIALLFIDLDRFKNINDSLGHELGDELLKEVAKRLHGSLREPDTLARMGGDEFVVILERIKSPQEVSMVARKLLECFTRSFLLDGHEVFTTASIGICLYPDDGTEVKDLMKSADVAMYRAKASGQNNYQFYKSEMNARTHDRLLLENGLRKALDEDQFQLYYQPQLNITTGQLIGMEALLRWQPPGERMVMPGEFIPLCEETGLILPISDWVFRAACLQLRHWQEQGLDPIRLAVNISALQFNQPTFLDTIDCIVAETGVDPAFLELELTESATMDNIEMTVEVLNKLKRRGFNLSIDDFGTGYSSLNYLQRLPINKLKIDRSFLRNVDVDNDNASIATSVIALAHSMRMEVLAEGVETVEQVRFLVDHGCQLGQGFLYSRPVTAEQMEKIIRAQKILI